MRHTIFFKSDYTYPDPESDYRPYGRLVYDIRGVEPSYDFFKLIHIKPGLNLCVCQHPPGRIPALAFEVNNAPISFSFLISGEFTNRFQGTGFKEVTDFSIASGTNAIASLHNIHGDMSVNPRTPIICVELKIDRLLLATYLEERIDKLSPEAADLLDPQRQVCEAFPLCRGMASAAMELLNPPVYTGVTLALYYESRALNLLALQLEHLTTCQATRRACGGFDSGGTGTDMDRLWYARQILVSDLKNPPTIAALARQCGINEFKLKKEFKQAFNTTIFAYLQRAKMEKAWYLLREGNQNVTEAAYELGYTNVSHFSAAFKKQFYINPGVLKKARISRRLTVPPEPGSQTSPANII